MGRRRDDVSGSTTLPRRVAASAVAAGSSGTAFSSWIRMSHLDDTSHVHPNRLAARSSYNPTAAIFCISTTGDDLGSDPILAQTSSPCYPPPLVRSSSRCLHRPRSEPSVVENRMDPWREYIMPARCKRQHSLPPLAALRTDPFRWKRAKLQTIQLRFLDRILPNMYPSEIRLSPMAPLPPHPQLLWDLPEDACSPASIAWDICWDIVCTFKGFKRHCIQMSRSLVHHRRVCLHGYPHSTAWRFFRALVLLLLL